MAPGADGKHVLRQGRTLSPSKLKADPTPALVAPDALEPCRLHGRLAKMQQMPLLEQSRPLQGIWTSEVFLEGLEKSVILPFQGLLWGVPELQG